MDSGTGDDSTETADADRSTGVTGGHRRPLVVAAALIVAIAIGVPLWASLRYRSAVHHLHDQLATISVTSADVVDARIERCWNDIAPASVRALVPTGGEPLSEVVADYVAAVESLGFEGNGGVVGTVASRPRADDLDDDVITVAIDDAEGRAVLIVHPFDADMVSCLPF